MFSVKSAIKTFKQYGINNYAAEHRLAMDERDELFYFTWRNYDDLNRLRKPTISRMWQSIPLR